MGHDQLKDFLRTHPGVAPTLLSALARRLRRTNDVLADLVFTDVPGRVAQALLGLADRFGRPVDDGLLVAHDLTQEELAQLRRRLPRDGEQGTGRLRVAGLVAPRGARRAADRRRATEAPRPLIPASPPAGARTATAPDR